MSSSARFRHKLNRSRFSKPKSANESEASITLVELNDITIKCSTPYRLPRLPTPLDSPTTADGGEKFEEEEKVFGRFGYEDVVRMPELGPSITRALINPHSSLAKSYRQAGLAVPKFRNAAITPSYRNTPFLNEEVEDFTDDEYDQHSMFKSVDLTNPSVTPVSRSISPAKSIKSIHWALGNERNPIFDTTGRHRAQGPFSRKFTVRCTPPPNWMRMKWGRSRAIAH